MLHVMTMMLPHIAVGVAGCCVQALTGPPTQDSIEDTSGYSYDYLLGMPIQNLTIEKVS